LTVSDNSSEVFCVRFSPDGKFLSAGCGDGAIRIFNVATGRLAYNLQSGSSMALPCTSLRFRPPTAISKTRNVLVAVSAAGTIQHWHMTSGKCLSTITCEDNQFYALDYRADGAVFAATGKDHTVRLYDETTKQETARLKGGAGYGASSTAGHSNRVFALKFSPTEPDILLTGGWDNTVQFWDARAGHSVRYIYGPHISGDSLDICKGEVLTGSWRPEAPLELWDYGTGKLIEAVPWNRGGAAGAAAGGARPTLLYAAQFSGAADGGRYIAAGGSGANEAKVFDHKSGNALVGTVTGLSRGVFTLDFSPAPDGDVKKLAVAGGDASIRIIDIIEEESEDAMP
jgi:COMPASS component SWD3